jgi:CHAT domain-containing protein
LALAVANLPACGAPGDPQVALEHSRRTFVHGDLKQSQDEAERGYQRFGALGAEWGWKFRILEAEALLWRGMSQQALTLLNSRPTAPATRSLDIQMLALEGVAFAHLHLFAEADSSLGHADLLCAAAPDLICGDAIRAHGVLAVERGQLAQAMHFFEQSLSFARAHKDQFLESTALLNLGLASLQEEHFDEALDWSNAAYRVSVSLDAGDVALVALENLGWAYYRLGDSEKALELFLEADKRAAQFGDDVDQASLLTDAGYVYMDAHDFSRADQSFRQALDLARQSKKHTFNALRVLARVALQTGDLMNASQSAQRALEIARESGNHVDELYPLLVQGQVAARRGNTTEAENRFHDVELDKICPVFLRWEAQHSLARLYEDESRADAADREYRAALATFEAARYTVRHEDFQLSFLTNASRIYDDYVHFLVARGKTDDALRWADYSRARTLAEGLGLLAKGSSNGPPPLNAQQIARRAGGTVLFYWLGEKQSYLWAITPLKTSLFTLPAAAEIDSVVQRYRKALVGPQDVLEIFKTDGTALYQMLVAPAQHLLTKDAKVLIVPDGSLNSLNFETLLVPGPKLHYWIEDATIADASSLRLLAASHTSSRDSLKTGAAKLLLIGDAVAANPEYNQLPKASVEIEDVEKHFAPAGRQVYTRAQATAPAYLESALEQYTYIHFVAHGTASRLSPLDSAVVLSKASAGEDSFKLYARDIIRRPLHADLVTISTCYGAGARAYTGEGLVGLSWAFLRAGAHNVIGALWEVSDASTPRLMDQLYGELQKGRSPEAALRSAKLSLLHSDDVFREPFYWAPFQLYTGS